MQMRGNLHRYRVSPSGKRNRMLQGTYMPSYRPVLKFAAYGLLYSLLHVVLGHIFKYEGINICVSVQHTHCTCTCSHYVTLIETCTLVALFKSVDLFYEKYLIIEY